MKDKIVIINFIYVIIGLISYWIAPQYPQYMGILLTVASILYVNGTIQIYLYFLKEEEE